MEEKFSILYHSNYPWSGMYSRYTCLAEALAKNSQVKRLIFLNPLQYISNVNGIKPVLKALSWSMVYRQRLDHPFEIMDLICPIILRRFAFFQYLYKKWQGHVFKNVSTLIRNRKKIFLLQGPSSYTLAMLRYLKKEGFFTVFDWGDLYEKHAGSKKQQQKMASLCREIAKEAHVVIGVSPKVTNIASSENPKSFLILNAVAYDRLVSKPLPPRAIEDRLKQPRICYFGLINEVKLDYELIRKVVQRQQTWQFIFIGPQQDYGLSTSLSDKKNVTFLEPMEGPELLKFLSNNVDLVFVPYNAFDEANQACSPMKLYETMALGLPFVAVESFDPVDAVDLIRLGKTPEEIINAIRQELKEDSLEKRRDRIAFAKENTWENRAEQLLNIMSREISSIYRQRL